MHCFIWWCLWSFVDYVHYRVFLLILYWHVKIFTFSSLCCHSLIVSLFDSFILLSLFYYSRDLVISLSWFCLLLSGIFSIRFVMLSLFDSFLLVIILLIWSLYCHYLDLIWFCALVGRYFIIILSLPCHYEIMFLILALFGLLCCRYVIIFIVWSLNGFLNLFTWFCFLHHLINFVYVHFQFSSLFCFMYIICYYFAISWLVSSSCHYALFDWFHYLLVCMILSFDSLHEIVFCNVLSLFGIFSLFCHSSSLICHYFIICINLLLALLCCFLSSIWSLCGPYVVIIISLFDYYHCLMFFCHYLFFVLNYPLFMFSLFVFFALIFIFGLYCHYFVIVMFFYFLSWCNYSILFHYCVIIWSLFDSFHLLLLCCV